MNPNSDAARLAVYRELLQVYSERPTSEAGFDDAQLARIRAIARDKRLVFLAFPPKCGGTFLREVVGTYLIRAGLSTSGTALLRGSFDGHGDSDRELYLPELVTWFFSPEDAGAVIHNHPVATSATRALLNAYGIAPTVMLRSIPDMLRSYADAAAKRRRMGGFGSSFAEDETYFELPEEDRKEFLVRNVAPWYVKFYASWLLGSSRGDVERVQFVRFDEFREAPARVAGEILSHAGIDVDEEVLAETVEHARSVREQLRFHRGVSGRGASYFSRAQHEQLERLVATYRDVDFRGLGLLGVDDLDGDAQGVGDAA